MFKHVFTNYKSLLFGNIHCIALKECIIFPKYDKIKKLNPTNVQYVNTYFDKISSLNSNEIIELHQKGNITDFRNMLYYINFLDQEILENLKMIQINNSGVAILRLIKDENLNDEDRVGFIELDDYKKSLIDVRKTKQKYIVYLFGIISLIALGYKTGSLLNI